MLSQRRAKKSLPLAGKLCGIVVTTLLLKGRRFAGWEGRFTPAQDSNALNIECKRH